MARKKKPQNLWSKIIYLFIMFFGFVCINCYVSDAIVEFIKSGKNIPTNGFITLNYIQNTGAAFSVLKDFPYLLSVLAILALIFLFSHTIRHAGSMSYNGIFWISVLMAGIYGNTVERVTLGYVRDYFYLKFVQFPIFNVSDIAINISVIMIILLLLKGSSFKQL